MPIGPLTAEMFEQRMPPQVAERLAAPPAGSTVGGFLHVVVPATLDETLAQWLGGADPSPTPFARTALGDIIYVRDLRERARAFGLDADTASSAHDVSMVDVRYKRTRPGLGSAGR